MILRPPAGTSSSELLWDAEVRRARRFARPRIHMRVPACVHMLQHMPRHRHSQRDWL